MDLKKLVRPNVLSLSAYEAKETKCRVKLDANESPYGFSINSKGISTNRYPDPEARALKGVLAKALKVKGENILLGNGSDELIFNLITVFGGPVLYPAPTFSMYGIISGAIGQDTVSVPLEADTFDLDEQAMLAALKKKRPALTFLSTPNNPTGNSFSRAVIIKIIKASKGIVVVDEAYEPYSSVGSIVPLLGKYENLLVMRTLSKVGLAALRVGFLIGSPEAVVEVNKVRLPFNVGSASQAFATRALKEKRLMRSHIKTIVKERKRLFKEMSRLEGVTPFPTDANFILFRVPDAHHTHASLLKRGVLVRNLNAVMPGCLRVTIGIDKENNAFLKALKRC